MKDIIKYKHSGKAPFALYVMCLCVCVCIYDLHSSGFQFQEVSVVRLVYRHFGQKQSRTSNLWKYGSC